MPLRTEYDTYAPGGNGHNLLPFLLLYSHKDYSSPYRQAETEIYPSRLSNDCEIHLPESSRVPERKAERKRSDVVRPEIAERPGAA